jgi:capsular polysaccharide biosynthesis protein
LKIRGYLSCDDLINRSKHPVTARTLGILFGGREYVRPKFAYLADEEMDKRVEDRFNEMMKFAQSPAKDLWLFELQNAHVIGQGTVVLADGQLVTDSAVEFLNHAITPDGFQGKLPDIVFISDKSNKIKGVSVLVKRPWYRNFGHFLVDLMAILPAIRASGISIDNIIYGDVPSGSLRGLMEKNASWHFPEANVIWASDQENITCEKLLYPQPVHVPPLFKHPIAMDYARDAIQHMFQVEETPKFGRRLYISRGQVGTRQIVNEEETWHFLQSKDFEIIYPENHSISEQVNMFRNAEIVVGVKGAAFTNLIFSNRSTSAIVLAHPEFIDPFFWDLCGYSGSNYSEIYCRRADDRPPSAANIIADQEAIARALNAHGIA